MWSFVNKYLGWRNWAVLHYNSIFENLFLVFFVLAVSADFSNRTLLNCVLFLLLSLTATSFGYLINDFADRKLDKAHGKANTFQNDSNITALAVLAFFIAITILLGVPFFNKPYFIILFFLWFFIAVQYSLPPGRFKERGLGGLIVVSIAQRLLPVWMLFAVFNVLSPLLLTLISFYILFRGLSSDLNHQLQDFENDRKTGTSTSVVRIGPEKMQKLFSIILALERLSLLLFLLAAMVVLREKAVFVYLLYFLSAGYALLYFLAEIKRFNLGAAQIEQWNPYAAKTIFQLTQLVFPNILLPVLLLSYLVFYNPGYAFFYIFYILIFKLYDPVTIKDSFFGKLFKMNQD